MPERVFSLRKSALNGLRDHNHLIAPVSLIAWQRHHITREAVTCLECVRNNVTQRPVDGWKYLFLEKALADEITIPQPYWKSHRYNIGW